MTISQYIKSQLLYPINPTTAEGILIAAGADGEEPLTKENANSPEVKRALAKCYIYFAESPQVSEAGATYNFTDAQREQFRRKANKLLEEIGEGEDENTGIQCGYMGEDF